MSAGFKPSEVVLFRAALPLIATFDRAENEFAGALMVRACYHNGDTWQAVSPEVVGAAMKKDRDPGGPWADLQRNPFLPSPDFHALVDKGFARWAGEPNPQGAQAIEFTQAGFERLARNVPPIAQGAR